MPRAFLALNFPIPVTRQLAAEVERQKPGWREAGYEVAWVPAANLHVTVRFLGTIADELVEGVAAAARRVARRHGPFEARAHGWGAFPSLERPTILWIGVAAPPLLTLQREVEAALVALGLPGEERPFFPHVTVGRVKSSGPSPLPGRLAAMADCGAGTLGELVLYESRTHAAGAEYVALARIPLGAKERE